MEKTKVVSKRLDGTELVAFVSMPTMEDKQEALIHGNAVACQILRKKDSDGNPSFILRSQTKKLLEESKIWTKAKEKELQHISKEINNLENKLKLGGNRLDGFETAKKLRKLRIEQMNIISLLSSLDSKTVESMTDDAEFHFLVTRCVFDECGERLFKDVHDYHAQENEPYYVDVSVALQKMLYGDVKDVLKQRIEYKFFKKYGYVNDDLDFIDKDGNTIDIETGRRIDSEGYYINELNQRVDVDGNLVNISVDVGEFS